VVGGAGGPGGDRSGHPRRRERRGQPSRFPGLDRGALRLALTPGPLSESLSVLSHVSHASHGCNGCTRLRRMRRFTKNPVCGTKFATFGPIHARIGPFRCVPIAVWSLIWSLMPVQGSGRGGAGLLIEPQRRLLSGCAPRPRRYDRAGLLRRSGEDSQRRNHDRQQVFAELTEIIAIERHLRRASGLSASHGALSPVTTCWHSNGLSAAKSNRSWCRASCISC